MKLIQEILCVIGGFFFIYLGTVFIRAQDDVRALKKELQTSRMQSIKKVQQQVDDAYASLQDLNQPIAFTHKFASKLNSFFKKR